MPTNINVPTLNRKKAPKLEFVKGLHLAAPDKKTLPNGVNVYTVGGLPQDAIKIEIILKAGKWYEDKKLIAKSTANLLKEGTEKYTAHEIAHELDYYGASIKTFSGTDIITYTLYSLNKYLDRVLPVLEEIIKRPSFPKNELNIFLTNNKEHLKVNLMKNDFVADRKISETLYGTKNPYGYYSNEADFNEVTREDLEAFHKRYYHSNNCDIIVSGKVDDSALQLVERYFGDDDWKGEPINTPQHDIVTIADKRVYEPVKGSVQSAIRIGKVMFNKAHPDYHKMNVLNTILGGYFGSRLMTNIREEKGYTYGIYSSVHSMLQGGYFCVATEVGVNVREDAVKQIYHELELLQKEPVDKEEMELVRNYLLGRMQSNLDGPFKVSGLFKGLLIYDLNIDYIYELIETINTVTTRDLQEIAVKYLNTAEMHELVVG